MHPLRPEFDDRHTKVTDSGFLEVSLHDTIQYNHTLLIIIKEIQLSAFEK